MNLLVVLRMMPDPEGELELAKGGGDLDREWLDLKLNDFDDHALEEAVLLKEAEGAKVIAVGVGTGANRALQMALARGADHAILIEHDEESMISSRGLAQTVAELAKTHGIDLVLTGVQTPEDLFGQLAPYVGAALGWPHVSATSGISLAGEELEVKQECGGGETARYAVSLPAVLGVQTASKSPRYVSGSKLRETAKAAIETLQPAESPLPQATRLLGLRQPDRSSGAVQLGDSPEEVAEALTALLAERGLTGTQAP